MPRKKAVEAEGNYIIVEHENPFNLPDLIVDVPKEDGTVDVSAWTAFMRKALGNKYNVKFRIWPVEAPAAEPVSES